MPKRSSTRDTNQIATGIVSKATDNSPKGVDSHGGKNPAAVELGRLGGLKGGRASREAVATQAFCNRKARGERALGKS